MSVARSLPARLPLRLDGSAPRNPTSGAQLLQAKLLHDVLLVADRHLRLVDPAHDPAALLAALDYAGAVEAGRRDRAALGAADVGAALSVTLCPFKR